MEIGSLANFCPLPSPPVIWPPELAARKRGLERYQAMSFDGLEGRRWLHGRKSKKKKNRRGLALHQSGTTVTVVRPHRRRRKRQQGVTRKIKGGETDAYTHTIADHAVPPFPRVADRSKLEGRFLIGGRLRPSICLSRRREAGGRFHDVGYGQSGMGCGRVTSTNNRPQSCHCQH